MSWWSGVSRLARRATPWLAVLLIPAEGVALAFGLPEVHSSLNDRLDVTFELTAGPAEQLVDVNVTLAPPPMYDKLEIPPPDFLNTLQVELEPAGEGRALVRITSTAPIKEPILELLVDVHWPDGRVLRAVPVILELPFRISESHVAERAPALGRNRALPSGAATRRGGMQVQVA